MPDSFEDPKTHPQYQYWRDQVYLKNIVLLAASHEIPVYQMRHEFTNYDDILKSRQFQDLEGPDRVAAYHAIHYTATVKALKHREYQLAEQRNFLLENRAKFERAQKELRRLLDIKAIEHNNLLQYKAKFEEISRALKLKTEKENVDAVELKAENIQLREDLDKIQHDYEDALSKIAELEKALDDERTHRKRLAKNNQSMGGRIGAYITNYKKQKQKADTLQKEVWSLKGKLQKIQKYAQSIEDKHLDELTQF